MGNQTSAGSDPNFVSIRKEVFQANVQKIQSLEREIQNNKSVILDQNNKIGTLTNNNYKLLRENYTLKARPLHIGASEENLQNIQRLEREIENNKAVVLEKNIKIDALLDKINTLVHDNYKLKIDNFDLTRSKSETKNQCEQLEKQNATLNREMEKYKSISETFSKKLKNENLRLIQSKDEVKIKCEQLEKNMEALKSELARYVSVPTFLKQILDLFENLQTLQKGIKNIEANISIDGQGLSLIAEKISNKKEENNKMENELKQKSLGLQYLQEITQLAETKEQIGEAEKKLQTINLNSFSFVDNKQEAVSSLNEKVKVCMKELEKEFENISNSINRIEEQVIDHKKGFVVLQNKNEQINREEQERYEKILTLLDQQYKVLWNLLYLVEPSDSHQEKNPLFEDDADDNVSKVSESESVLLSTDGKKHCAVMLYNLKEGPGDQQKVIDIISSICSIPTKEIKMQRLGVYTGNKSRPIKVSVPTISCVTMILSNKLKLKDGQYQHIKLGTFNKERGKTKGEQVRKETSSTFAYFE